VLKKRKRCRIVLPDWLENGELHAPSSLHTSSVVAYAPPSRLLAANLEEVLRQERADKDAFQGLEFHYVEIANLLLKA
jgi:hypothetical protein